MGTWKSGKSAYAVAHSRIWHDRQRRARNKVRRAGHLARRAAFWALGITLLIVSLSACGGIVPSNDPAAPDTQSGGWFTVIDVNVHGKMVPCVTWKYGYAGGLSCDFAGAK